MSTHASVRLLLPVIGICMLCGCDAAQSAVNDAMAMPHRLIERMRECQRERIDHHTEQCEPAPSDQRVAHDAPTGDPR